ncbi:MAG: hypothetical protein H6933_06870 [Burkholderiaceae bacterium]|nr:hypothetical protein [Burkholderiaceae bacterium]
MVCLKRCGVAVLAGVFGAAVVAAEPTPAPGPVASSAEELRAGVRDTALWLARGVDSWFGDKPFSDGGSVTEGRLGLSLLHRPDEDTVSVRFNARFRLPNLEDKAYVFVGRDNPREVVTDQPGAFTRTQRLQRETTEDTRFFAGVGVLLRESTDLRVGFRGGLKPYVQLRYKHPLVLDERRLAEFRQTFFWTLDDHLGSTTAMSVERAVHDDLAVRWLVSGTVTQASRRLGVSSILGAYQLFGDRRQLALELIATAEQRTGVGLTDYGVQARWQQPVHADWLVGEVLVGHFWPRANDTVPRDPGWAAGLTLTLHF